MNQGQPSGSVALQAWTNDQLKAAKEIVDVQLRDLKDHLEKIQAEKDKALAAALSAAEKAVQKAEANTDKWQASANEWRGAMTDKDKLLVQRGEFEAFEKSIMLMIADIKTRLDLMQGKSQGLNAGWAILIAVVGLIVVVIGIVGVITRFTK